VTDRIDLALGGDEELLDAARQHEDYLAGEVLASEISFGDGDGDGSAAHIDGRELCISLSRAAV